LRKILESTEHIIWASIGLFGMIKCLYILSYLDFHPEKLFSNFLLYLLIWLLFISFNMLAAWQYKKYFKE